MKDFLWNGWLWLLIMVGATSWFLYWFVGNV